MKILANNPDQEEAEEVVAVEYSGESLEMGFNVSYLIDIPVHPEQQTGRITLSDPNSSALLEAEEGDDAVYVVCGETRDSLAVPGESAILLAVATLSQSLAGLGFAICAPDYANY